MIWNFPKKNLSKGSPRQIGAVTEDTYSIGINNAKVKGEK